MICPADHAPAPSWWIGLDRADLQQAIAAHVPYFKQQARRKMFLDHIGASLLRDTWEPRNNPSRIGREA